MSTCVEPTPTPDPVDPRTVHITLEVQDVIQTAGAAMPPPAAESEDT